MPNKHTWLLLAISTLALFNINTVSAQSKQFDKVVVFGGSLDDSGNAFVLLSNPAKVGFDASCELGTAINVPPYEHLDDLYIPDGIYAKGGHHVSNGATWVEVFSRHQGLAGSTRPDVPPL